ncbi:hypothetical protein HA402_004194 [Bradysia odoriphaga]|nr:hypothetical protein HA402_004194 [Bradysia odoriphaga]
MDYIGLGCCALAFVLYLNTLDAGFVYDDRRAILGNPDVLGTTPWRKLIHHDFWGTDLSDTGSHGSYRPLCVLSFKLNHVFGGFRPVGYHLVNVLLHCLATGLVVKVARQLLPPLWGPAVAGALFASHPIHTEAVAGIVGRADLAACNFYLLTFLAYSKHVTWREKCDQRHWVALGGAVLLAAMAMLFKETAVTALLVCAIYDVIRAFSYQDKHRIRSLSILGIALATLVQLRLSIPAPATDFSTADNPVAKSTSIWTRFLTFTYLPVFNFKLLLYPSTLSFDWGMDALPRLTTIFDARNIISLIFYASLTKIVHTNVSKLKARLPQLLLHTIQRRTARAIKKRIQSQLSDCVCVICKQGVSLRHSSSCRAINNNNIPAPSVQCGCPPVRHPSPSPTPSTKSNGSSAGSMATNDSITPPTSAAILLSIALLTLPFLPAANLFFYVGFVVAERILYLPSVGYCLLVGLGVGKLMDPRRGPLRSQRKRYAVMACVSVMLIACSVKTIYRNYDWRDEESLYRSAIGVNPPKALGNLGSVLSSQGRYIEAKEALQLALKYRPNMADVHYNLGILFQNHHDYKGAVECFQKAIHFRPSLALAYLNLGTSLISLGRCQEAASVLREGSKLDGTGLRDRTAHNNARVSTLLQLGGLYAEQGKLQRALAVYREALHNIPESFPPQAIYHRLGDTLAKLNQWTEAERFHQAALEVQPDHVATHVSYGTMLARNSSRTSEAEQWFKRALKLAPLDSSVRHHYAEFLSTASRHSEACEQRIRAAELSPTDYSLVVSAATALRLLEKKPEAEKWYRLAVKLRPDDARSHTNLGAILHLLGRSAEAAASYRYALKIQPGDPTTLANLAKLGVVEVA